MLTEQYIIFFQMEHIKFDKFRLEHILSILNNFYLMMITKYGETCLTTALAA